MPTILDLMGQPLPENLAGVSRRNVLAGEADLDDNDVVIIWDGDIEAFGGKKNSGVPENEQEMVDKQSWRSIITADNWKLTVYRDDLTHELYDLNTDPHELNNQYHAPGNQSRLHDMTARLKQWQQRVHDPLEMSRS